MSRYKKAIYTAKPDILEINKCVNMELTEFGKTVTNFCDKFRLPRNQICKELNINEGTLRSVEYGNGTASTETYLKVKWYMRKYISAVQSEFNDFLDEESYYNETH